MVSHVTISIILVFVSIILLRGFQLPTKLLLRGAIILFVVQYAVLKTSIEYA